MTSVLRIAAIACITLGVACIDADPENDIAAPALGSAGTASQAFAGVPGGPAAGIGPMVGALTYAPTFTAIYNEILANAGQGCALVSCHGQTRFVFTNQLEAFTVVTTAAAAGPACAVSGKKLVVPNNPAESLLLLKVKPAPPCGERMRVQGPYLTQPQIDQIANWIMAGAPNN